MFKTTFRILTLFLLIFPICKVNAQEVKHINLIINQVRGEGCCDKGNIQNLESQLETLSKNQLSSNFAIRFDALVNQNYLLLLKNANNIQIGGLLEIIPDLALEAKVTYKGDSKNWHEAQNTFLIGYVQEERKKIIDTYMAEFKKQFNYYPEFTVSWMIDAWSLEYLKKEYGVLAHQITREQFGTDSYTLYGGPVHYPYWPSRNWALIPDQNSKENMPLILRQTIMDPVYCYGDLSNSFTSQPNDYLQRNDNLEYFKHLFLQAHKQNTENYTFSLIGIENSMDQKSQIEYLNQLNFLEIWRNNSNLSLLVSEFVNYFKENTEKIKVYYGKSQKNNKEQAIWINTPNYRARIRLSDNQLFVSDLRNYNPEFIDPYYENKATSMGWWITPFSLDGSRFYYNQKQNENSPSIKNDFLLNREKKDLTPLRITIDNKINPENLKITKEGDEIKIYDKDKLIAEFFENSFRLNSSKKVIKNEILKNIIKDLTWFSNNEKIWGFIESKNYFDAFSNPNFLQRERDQSPILLFPEVKIESVDKEKSSIYINNKYAQSNRNPIRLIFFPRNSRGNSVLINKHPLVETNNIVKNITISEPNGNNGMTFIDIDSDIPQKTNVKISYENYEKNTNIYFSPNCKEDLKYCITHPIKAIWYLKNYIQDKKSQTSEAKSNKDLYQY